MTTITALAGECGALAKCTYGSSRPVEVRHPLSRAVPVLARLLDMPVRELPGDHHMPRVQDGAFGASERFAVSPGREEEGYLAAARRAFRPPAVAFLSQRIRGLGGRQADTVPAGPGSA